MDLIMKCFIPNLHKQFTKLCKTYLIFQDMMR